jgi:uncharacterized protein (TIGR02246 family)
MKRANCVSLVRDKAIVIPVVVVLFFAIPALAGGEDHSAVKASSAKWVAAFNAGDLQSMAALATEDIVLLPEHAQPVRGRDAVVSAWRHIVENKLRLELTTEELAVSGGLAYQMGEFSYLLPQGTVVRTRKFLRIWKRTDGRWRLHRSMHSSNQPIAKDLPVPLPPPKDPVLDENTPPRETGG